MKRTVVHFTDSASFGGAEQCIVYTLAQLDRRQWRPVLFHCPEPGIAQLLEATRRLGVPSRGVPNMDGARVVAGLPRFLRALRAESPAVFHAHLNRPLACKQAIVAAAASRGPVVVASAHHVPPTAPNRWDRVQLKILSHAVARFIAVSPGVALGLHQRFGIPERKIALIPNGIDSSPSPTTTQLSDPARLPTVLAVARLEEAKGLHILLCAAAAVPDVRFVIAGDGPRRQALEAQAAMLGIAQRVSFLGQRADVPHLMAACDVFVLPSLGEGLPLAPLEAMAAARPVVASAIAGITDVVQDRQTGLLVPAGDSSALAAAIQRLVHDPALRTRLGQAGQQRVRQEFSSAVMVDRLTSLYEQLLVHPKRK